MTFLRLFIFASTLALLMTGCGAIGYNLEKRTKEEWRPPFDEQGRARPHPDADPANPMRNRTRYERLSADPNSLTSQGNAIDEAIAKEVIKEIFTPRKNHDMKMRDIQDCLDDEVKVCSISSGCSCREKPSEAMR